MKITLFVRAPKKPEKRVVVHDDVVIGRGKDCNLRVLSNDVSRKHCRLVVGESEVAVRDLGSGNGTLINNQKAEPNVDTPLISGDIVRIGPLVIKVEFEGTVTQTAEQASEVTSSPSAGLPVEAAVSHEAPALEESAELINNEQDAEQFLEPADEVELLPDDEFIVEEDTDQDRETVVFEQRNAFSPDEDELELQADDDEGLSDEGDYLDADTGNEDVDPGFADFLDNVDPPPK